MWGSAPGSSPALAPPAGFATPVAPAGPVARPALPAALAPPVVPADPPVEPQPPSPSASRATASRIPSGNRYLACIVKSAASPPQADTADPRTLSGEPVGELYTEADAERGSRPPGVPPLEDPIGRPG